MEDALRPVTDAPPNLLVKGSSLSYEAKSFEPRRNRDQVQEPVVVVPPQVQPQAVAPIQLEQSVQQNSNMAQQVTETIPTHETPKPHSEKDETDNIINNNIIKLTKPITETVLKPNQLEQVLNDVNAANLAQNIVDQTTKGPTSETSTTCKVFTDENKNEASIAPTNAVTETAPGVIKSSTTTPAAKEDVAVKSDVTEPVSVSSVSQAAVNVSEVPKETEPVAKPAANETPTRATEAPAAAAKPVERKISLINYEKGQWSPSNPEGKRKYSVEQLYQLGNNSNPLVAKKPELPPSLARSLDNSKSGGSMRKDNQSLHVSSNLMPSFARNAGGGGGGGGSMSYGKRPSQQGGRSMSMGGNKSGSRSGDMMKRMSSHKMQPDVKLNEAENAWKPRHLQTEDNLTPDERETEELCRKFRSILNKLTPENFSILRSQLGTVSINTRERLEKCIQLVFEKAISEPNYSVIYSQFCHDLSGISLPAEASQAPPAGQAPKKITFKVMLLNQCQAEFEKHKDSKSDEEVDQKAINNELNEQKKKEMTESFEEKKFKLRRRAVGTVRFIGELYKIKMLNDKIMHECIKLLLSNEDEDSLECLCKLLTTIGKSMETPSGKNAEDKDKEPLKEYFEKLEAIANQKTKLQVCSRIR